MSGKRPHDGEDSPSDTKRIRSNDGSPAPVAAAAASTNGETDAEARKRALKERMAAIKAKQAAGLQQPNGASVPPAAAPTVPPPPPAPVPGDNADLAAKRAEVQRKIDEMKARRAAQTAQGGRTASPANGASSGATAQQNNQPSEREARIAEARARAAELSKQKNAVVPSVPVRPPRQDGRGATGGLGIGIHPSLMGDLNAPSANKGKTAPAPKFSTTRGNQQPEAPKINPYITAEDEATADKKDDETYDPSVVARKGGARQNRQLVFNQKGKFMAQANALRQQARLEEMKRRIAAETRKVEIEEASDKAFLVPAPPEFEWWDQGLLPEEQGTHENCLADGRNKIFTPDSIVTNLIQHPVLLQAPQDKFIPPPKPLMLTTQEQKKLRRQRRMADMKEEQAKIRLGLVEPPPPKVKKSNMMRVLGEQAVKDPTAVEARVNKEIAQRQHDHDKANHDRELSKEQRAEKLKRQQKEDEERGIKVCVFRVDNLSSGKHRYQVDKNAKDNGLTGIVVLHPELNLIIVEGGSHSMANYKKLMLNRIKWTENSVNLNGANNSTTFVAHNERAPGQTESATTRAAEWCNPLDANGDLKDLSENRCILVWEGDEATRGFKRWGSRAVETDGEAREVLKGRKMENMWTLARSK